MGKVVSFTCKRGIKMASIFDVANYFLCKLAYEDDSSITPLKLQKLCYYAQGWSYAWDGKKLFDEDFQAWAHGPANPQLYEQYRMYGSSNIPSPEYFDFKVFNESQKETMDVVWSEYGIYDGKYLERLTHQEEPWREARAGYNPGERCTNIISKHSIREYFVKLNSQEN